MSEPPIHKNFLPQNLVVQTVEQNKMYYLKHCHFVCMKYTAQGEGKVANIALGKAECYICHKTLTKHCIFYTNKAAVL